jgi:hypothetical protein
VNPAQAKFCLGSVIPLVLRFGNCGTQLPAGAKLAAVLMCEKAP